MLFYFHRTFKGIIIAFLPPAFALALTFGTLGTINPELSIISVAIVSLLMGLGVDYSIHLMNRLAEEKTIEDMEDRRFLAFLMNKEIGRKRIEDKAHSIFLDTAILGVLEQASVQKIDFIDALAGQLNCFIRKIHITPGNSGV